MKKVLGILSVGAVPKPYLKVKNVDNQQKKPFARLGGGWRI